PSTSAGSCPYAISYRSSLRAVSADSTHPAGLGTLIPSPLSSHTHRRGSGSPWYPIWALVLSAACAVAWLSEASPKEQSTTASGFHGLATPRRAARSTASAMPTARGRCDAIVEVIGRIASSLRPNIL